MAGAPSTLRTTNPTNKSMAGTKFRAYVRHADFASTTVETVTLREILVSSGGDGKTINVGRDEEARQKIEQSLIEGKKALADAEKNLVEKSKGFKL